MIEITVTQTITTTRKVIKNFLVEEKPTATRESFGNSREIVCDKKYEVREVEETISEKRTLLNQQIEKDDTFNLPLVILAVNRISP